jgi:hypothetical protein
MTTATIRRTSTTMRFRDRMVVLGGVKYAVGALACAMLAEKIKHPEQRYLIMAAIGAGIGALDTAWRAYRKARERAEQDERWQDRIERERTDRMKVREQQSERG